MPSSIWRIAACLAILPLAACGRSDRMADSSSLARVTQLESQLAGLESQITRVQDVSAIKRLQRAYGYYLDAADWDQMAALFAEDGSLEIGLDGVYVGKKRVRQYLYALGGGRSGLKEGQLNEHMQLQPVINLSADGRSAQGRWHTLIMAGQYHQSALWGDGIYENEYVKDNGVWKIRKLHWYQTFLVPYAGGWASNKDVNGGIYVSKTLPPDKPPTERYETWPGVFTPPFHYLNPVTGR